jgi:hypothetical protein
VKLVSIPTTRDYLDGAEIKWGWTRFLPAIAKRAKVPVAELLDEILSGDIQVHIIVNDVNNDVNDVNEARAIAGTRLKRRGADLIGEVVFLTGSDLHLWAGLLGDLERYLTEHVGCKTIKPIARLGYAKFLKAAGYRQTHQIWEKDF